VPIFLKSGSLNLLETSEPVKACNGIDLPHFTLVSIEKYFEAMSNKVLQKFICIVWNLDAAVV
jgi:hypothetical protein